MHILVRTPRRRTRSAVFFYVFHICCFEVRCALLDARVKLASCTCESIRIPGTACASGEAGQMVFIANCVYLVDPNLYFHAGSPLCMCRFRSTVQCGEIQFSCHSAFSSRASCVLSTFPDSWKNYSSKVTIVDYSLTANPRPCTASKWLNMRPHRPSGGSRGATCPSQTHRFGLQRVHLAAFNCRDVVRRAEKLFCLAPGVQAWNRDIFCMHA